MFRKPAVFIATLTFFAFVLGPTTGRAGDFPVGSTVENFSLPDTNGKMQSLNELKGKNGAVVIFLSAQCPVVKGYNERINQLAADYEAKGITFIGINSNSTESLDWVKSHAAENYKFPVLIDKGNVLAEQIHDDPGSDARGVLLRREECIALSRCDRQRPEWESDHRQLPQSRIRLGIIRKSDRQDES